MWWWQRKREERELDEELKTHFELEARQDTDPDGARRAFGNITRIREETRETWGWFGLREWISARIKTAIQHDYDRKLETHKAQLKSEQDLAILNIKTALAREAAFHAAAHASFAEGQKATMERKLSGVDRLWSGVVQFRAGLPPELPLIDVMSVDEYRATKDHPSFQKLAGGLSEEDLRKLSAGSIEDVRPYVGEYKWAIFYCYQTLLVRISIIPLHLSDTRP